jgi:hypothetical protein
LEVVKLARVKKGMKRVNIDIPVSLHTALRVEAIQRHMRFRDLVVERLGGSRKRRVGKRVRRTKRIEGESLGEGGKA